MKKPETYIVVFTLFVLLAVVNLLLSLGIYQRTRDSVVTDAGGNSNQSESTRSDIAVSDLKGLLNQSPLRRNSYQLIADKNLFSPRRTAWQPPVVEKAVSGDVAVTAARRKDVVLCGIFKLGQKKGALLEFPNLNSKWRKRTMYAGDTAVSELERRQKTYTLMKIEEDSVTVRDYKGVVFNVSLYDGKKAKRQAVPAAKSSVTVDSASAPKVSSSVVVAGSEAAAKAKKVAKQGELAARLKRKVEKGQLKKISTPFGTAYLKNNKLATMKSEKK